MLPYVFLVIFIILARVFIQPYSKLSKSKADAIFLKAVFIYLYIFCVIRSFEVGIDIPGYIRMYDTTANVNWNNWDYVYFEKGYIFFMKICNFIGLSARGFFCVVYALILLPVYLFIRRESIDPLLSVITFISFQFFVFDLTGLRQAIAMSICMIALMVALKHNKKSLITFIALVFIASTIHKSALSFFLVYPIIRFPINKKFITLYGVAAVVCFIMNKAGVAAILEYFNNTTYEWSNENSSQLGLSLFLIIIIGLFGLYSYLKYFKQGSQNSSKQCQAFVNMVMTGICFMCLVNGSTLLRATMYFYFPIIVLLPIITKSFGNGIDKIAKYVIISVFVTHFFINELTSFNVTPYEIATTFSLTK